MIVIGERINGMFNVIKQAIANDDKKPVQEMALKQIQAGANYLDVNVGPTSAEPEKTMVWADRDQIGQALINLLDNAVKYTPERGSITVSVKDAGNEVHVTVADTRIGIPRKHLNRIFERFYRVDKNRSRELGGTGLGLSIVKHIIQSHGGRVWVRSELEEGSVFAFSVPKPDILLGRACFKSTPEI